ncbi:MAG TPA: hypothetical protein VKR32_08180 [Puia sp.]|nr:hypothetical protein [Puia sp.]
MEVQQDSIFKLGFDENAKELLKSLALWAKICSVCAFIGYGINLIVAFLGRGNSRLSEESFNAVSTANYSRAGAIASALISAAIGCAINYFLYRFSIETNRGVNNLDQFQLNEGFANLKTYFKILGIILVIALILFGLVFLGVLASGGVKEY